MNMARVVSEMSTCPRASVGCVLVRDRRVLTSGFNGSPSGFPHCSDAGCLMVDNHCVRALHAEQNAIIQAALHGVTTLGCIAYVTHYPCHHCAKMLINAGARKVVYLNEYPNEYSTLFFAQAAIPTERIDYA